jgi:hypothetical protein
MMSLDVGGQKSQTLTSDCGMSHDTENGTDYARNPSTRARL